MRTLIAIPAFNEEASLGQVVKDLSQHHELGDVLVVDDGSSDATFAVAKAAGVRVLHHAVNLGVGAALGTAFQYAARNGYEFLVQLDADGQHRPEFLESLLKRRADFDIVIGSRFASGGRFRTTKARRSVMRVIAWVVSRYARTRLTDVTSGFRLSGPRAIALFSQHYPVEYLGDTVESIILASRQGLTVTEVPVTMSERAGGLPSQSLLRALLYTGRIFLILILATFRSAPPALSKRGGKDECRMNPQILAIVLSLVMFVVVLVLLRFYFLPEKYAVVWLVAAVVSVILSLFPAILNNVSEFFGISQPINLLFFLAFFVVLLLLMQLSLELARTRDELRKVIQRLALELEEKEDRKDVAPKDPKPGAPE